MDKSEEFVKMCEEVKEIQELWEPKDGDWFFWNKRFWLVANYEKEGVVSYENSPKGLAQSPHMTEYYDHAFRRFDGGYEWEDDFVCQKKDAIWLPTQSQLQAMVTSKTTMCWQFLDFADWIRSQKASPLICYSSAEQLWLAFVMHEKYQKVWNAESKTWEKKATP